jgi:carboxypeptidase T
MRIYRILLAALFFILIILPVYTDYNTYPTYYETVQRMQQLQNLHPEIVRLVSLGKTAENRDIWAIKISDNVSAEEQEPAILFTGLTHASEWISLPVTLYIAEQLVRDYETDTEIKGIVDNTVVWLIPIVNPDGYVYSHRVDRNWRKNRAKIDGKIVGVDINRNFSYGWNNDNGFYNDTTSVFYKGPYPESEAETRALIELAAREKFRVVVDYHCYKQYLLYPYGSSRTEIPDKEQFIQILENVVKEIKAIHGKTYTPVQMSSLYPYVLPTGTSTDYYYTTFGAIAFTIELRPLTKEGGGIMLPESEIKPTCEENYAAAKYLCRWIYTITP